ncbi:lactosylceramide 1,3-N-acetyl-beta-D-glucosaminyltransferase A-like [Mya arenaria]|uniref:lactosylceramide 1,3-N-acetyl-beta-D-glucosaminyltransferase A-like n=1 Tax=Mya arenaria TaxID=6604 RepID=UPI0022E0F850|nr:lactosylceramide 1,3-N-acetyl-beta-D-glucosaminyltransferase A-like [Mya arenaria]
MRNVYVNLHKYEYTLNNKYACNGNVLAVILVNSAPDKPSERMQIRNTWGSVRFHSGATVVTLFAIAQTEDDKLQSHIESESKQYVDIIQGNFLDSYRNLTYKTVMGLDWVHKFCNHTKFVLKVDDDTLIDTYHLVDYLLQRSPDGDIEDFLYCSTFRNQGPIRRSDDKWFVPMTEYPYSKYPPYCEGFAYIMSYDVSKKLYEATETVKIYWIDDVYLTGLAAIQARITHTNMESGHSYKLLDTDNLSKIVQSSLFLLAKYDSMRPNWDRAWDDIKSLHKK